MNRPHVVQEERGRTIDCPRGRRWITTFMKLPTMSPKIETGM